MFCFLQYMQKGSLSWVPPSECGRNAVKALSRILGEVIKTEFDSAKCVSAVECLSAEPADSSVLKGFIPTIEVDGFFGVPRSSHSA